LSNVQAVQNFAATGIAMLLAFRLGYFLVFSFLAQSCQQQSSSLIDARTRMFEKILLAYDGSDHAAAALQKAADLALLCKADLHLLGVISTVSATALLQADAPPELFAQDRGFIEAALADAAKSLSGKGLKVETAIREGSPAHEISAYAQTKAADLAVIGHSDKGFLARWFEGSIGAALIRDLPCSLLIATNE
jgi:nucleotide-binding universal stress UspA family protein